MGSLKLFVTYQKLLQTTHFVLFVLFSFFFGFAKSLHMGDTLQLAKI